MKKVWIALVVLVLASGLARAEDKVWTENFEDAKARAAKEGKDLLLDFTGSDWCGVCKILKAEVFDTELFIKEAPKDFILVKLDFPLHTEQNENIAKQNQALQEKFGIQGFPTIVLTNAKGEEYTRTTYMPGGPETYLKQLKTMRQMKADLPKLAEKAEKAEGIERAKVLDELITAQFILGKETNPEHFREIVKLDADGKAGLKPKYEAYELEEKLMRAEQSNDEAQFNALLDEGLKRTDFPVDVRQRLMRAKGVMIFKKQPQDALKLLKEAVALDPKTMMAAEISQILPQLEMYLQTQGQPPQNAPKKPEAVAQPE